MLHLGTCRGRGGGRIGPIAASLGSDGGGLAPDSKDILMRFLVARKEAVPVDD